LLWAVARLRSIVLFADQLQRMLATLPGPLGAILESLREMLKGQDRSRFFQSRWLA
jgi:hypothetical protein